MTIADIDSIALGKQFTAEQLDEKRQNRSAYDYLCRLHAVRNWLAACLAEESIPAPIDLEENLRNGVLLARIGGTFAPDVVDKIFDLSQEKYNAAGPVYRHTDNINAWRRSMIKLGLPEIIIPETVDIYEGRNIRTVFCIYALAIYALRLRWKLDDGTRNVPAIRNEAGNLNFSEDEMEQIKLRLQEEGVNVSWGEFGGLIAKRGATNVAADVLEVIGQAVAGDDVDKLLGVLLNHESGFIFVEKDLGPAYLEALKAAKSDGAELTASHVQAIIQIVNETEALSRLERYLQTGHSDNENSEDLTELFHILADLDPEKVIQAALPLYNDLLHERRANQEEPLSLEQVHDIVNVSNACIQVRISALQGNADDVYLSLQDPALSIGEALREAYKAEYFHGLLRICKEPEPESPEQKTISNLKPTIAQLISVVTSINQLTPDDLLITDLLRALDSHDETVFVSILTKLNIEEVNETYSKIYFKEATEKRPQSKEELQVLISKANVKIAAALKEGTEVLQLNNNVIASDEKATQALLTKSTWADQSIVQPAVIEWYYRDLSKDLKTKYANETGNHEPETLPVAKVIAQPYGPAEDDFVVVEIKKPSETATIVPETKSSDVQKWPLNSEEIKSVLRRVNEKFDNHYRKAEHQIAKAQKTIREHLKSKYAASQQRQRERAAQIIQNGYRGMKSRNRFDEFRHSSAPSVDAIRPFTVLLRDNDKDYDEELNVERTRSKITHLIKNNAKLDEDLIELDKKIGLLVKNRISLQDVLDHSDKIEETKSAFDKRQPSLRRPARKDLASLEVLFFHLQAEPIYLTNVYNTSSLPVSTFIGDIILPLFHFGSEKREEYLLVQVFAEILNTYIEQLTLPNEFLNNKTAKKLTATFTSMFQSFPSAAAVTVALKSDLIEFQKGESAEEHFGLSPAELFESMHGREPRDLEEALSEPRVDEIVEKSKSFVIQWTDRFTKQLIDGLELPRNVRYLIKNCAISLRNHFTGLKETEIHQLVAKFLFVTYVEHALTDSKFVKRETGQGLSVRQTEILRVVVQLIRYAVDGQGYGADQPHMQSLNHELIVVNSLYTSFTASHLTPETTDAIYGLNRYSAFADIIKPKLHIETKYVKSIVKAVDDHKTAVFKEDSQLLKVLATVKVPEEETVVLNLRPMAHSGLEGHEGNELFVETKKQIVELLLSGLPGNTIPRLLNAKPTREQEDAYQALLKDIKEGQSIASTQESIRTNLAKLEALNLTTSTDGYQSLITAIAKDIISMKKYRIQRKEQLDSLKKLVGELEATRAEYMDRLDKYQKYLDHTLDNISVVSRKPSIQFQKGGRAEKKFNKRVTKEKPITISTTAEKLVKKGIAVAGQMTPKELSKTQVEISNNPEVKGAFSIVVSTKGKDETTTAILFQDLLTADAAKESEFKIEERLRVEPTAFVAYLNRKYHVK
uniref:Calponin-homology (CH) domain-containing protein n=1 Tax=Panagrellus redivivus TaxID=6233 RepID=A0A7E4V127_PANRE